MGTNDVFAGTERGVFYSPNTGVTWSRVSNLSKWNGFLYQLYIHLSMTEQT